MIIINGHIQVKAENADALFALAKEVMAETHKEKGCIQYEMSACLRQPATIHIYEEWETADDLKAHGSSAHLAAFREKLGELGVLDRQITRRKAGEKL